MESKKELVVSAIENGTVIDHIPTQAVYQVIHILGLEEYKAAYNEPEEIIKVADARMYYGKQHGRNILIFEDLD